MELFSGVPTRLIKDNGSMFSLRYLAGDFVQVELHGLGVGVGHNDGGSRIPRRAYRTEDVGVDELLLAGDACA